MASNEEFVEALQAIAAQANAYEKRAKSKVEKQYGDVMHVSAMVLSQFAGSATFEQLIQTEKAFQQNDLLVYAQRPATVKAVQEGIDDIEEGEAAYRQLIQNTEGYKAHGYRKKERLAPERIIPLDAMRRALRGQVKRVENYRSNVMGNSQEQDFMSARIAMLRRAEKLYDAIQRERLLPTETET